LEFQVDNLPSGENSPMISGSFKGDMADILRRVLLRDMSYVTFYHCSSNIGSPCWILADEKPGDAFASSAGEHYAAGRHGWRLQRDGCGRFVSCNPTAEFFSDRGGTDIVGGDDTNSANKCPNAGEGFGRNVHRDELRAIARSTLACKSRRESASQ